MSLNRRAIEIHGCRIVRGERPLFKEPVSASFESGRLNIIAGPNGSGKTSLLDILALRANDSACTVCRDGHSRPREIAYLPQSSTYVLDVKINDIIHLAFRRMSRLPPPPDIEGFIGRPSREIGEISGGQRQILLFWLVASQPAHVFIYDEPLRHLDDRAASYVTAIVDGQVARGELVILSDHSTGSRWRPGSHRLELAPYRAQSMKGDLG